MIKNNLTKNREILAVTSDPYDCIWGYALIFQKMFNNINFAKMTILLNEGGKSNNLIVNKKCEFVYLKLRKKNYFLRGFEFVIKGLRYTSKKRYDYIISNCELAEILLTLTYSKIFRIKSGIFIHDLYTRTKEKKEKILNYIRNYLIKYFDVVLVNNEVIKSKISHPSIFVVGYILCDNYGKTI